MEIVAWYQILLETLVEAYSPNEKPPNKRVQSDAAAAGDLRAKLAFVWYLELKPISVKARRG